MEDVFDSDTVPLAGAVGLHHQNLPGLGRRPMMQFVLLRYSSDTQEDTVDVGREGAQGEERSGAERTKEGREREEKTGSRI